MNNKGFAISTMLYGLSIVGLMLALLMVQTMSANRTEQQKLVKTIEGELSDFGVLSEYFSYDEDPNATYDSDGNVTSTDYGYRKFKLPVSGWYKIELWESSKYVNFHPDEEEIADSLMAQFEAIGNGGSYTSQTLYLKENTTLYIYLGRNVEETATADNKDLRETTICNVEYKSGAKCNCVSDSNKCMATSYRMFAPKGTYQDPLEERATNVLDADHMAESTVYYGNHMNIDERGKARITLVSTKKPGKFHPIQSLAERKSGTFYIIDIKNGSALAFDKIIMNGNKMDGSFIDQSIQFTNLDGSDYQKWKYNPQDRSLINVRTSYALSVVPPISNLNSVVSTDIFSNETQQKWTIEDAAPANYNNVGMRTYDDSRTAIDLRARALVMNGNSQKFYVAHNRKLLPTESTAAIVEQGDNEEFTRIEQSASLPTHSLRSYKFYMINAY